MHRVTITRLLAGGVCCRRRVWSGRGRGRAFIAAGCRGATWRRPAAMSSRRSRQRSAGRRRCRFPPTIRFQRRSARSARRCSTTSGCRSTTAAPAQAATIRAKGFADGKAQGVGVPGRPLKRHTPTLVESGLGVARCSGTAARAASKSRSPGRSSRPTRWRSRWRRWSRACPPIRRCSAPSPKPSRSRRRSTPAISPRRSRLSSAPSSRRRPVSIAGSPATMAALSEREIAGFRLFTGKAGCVQLPQRLCLHRLCVPRHRPAGRRSRPRRRAAAAGRGARLQDAGPARDRPLRALHARRLAGDARRRAAPLSKRASSSARRCRRI